MSWALKKKAGGESHGRVLLTRVRDGAHYTPAPPGHKTSFCARTQSAFLFECEAPFCYDLTICFTRKRSLHARHARVILLPAFEVRHGDAS